MSTIYTIEIRRGLRSALPSTAHPGEPFFCTDTGELFIWNGTRMVEITAYAGSVSVADLASVEGNGTKVQLTSQGATTAGDVVTYDSLGNVQDSGVLLANLATVTSLSAETTRATAAEALLVPKTLTVNGHALSGNVVISASDLTTGTLPHAQLPALVSGDIPNNTANTSGTAGGLSANIAESQVTSLVNDLAGKVGTGTTVNGHALSGNITLALSDFGGTIAIGQTVLTTLGDLLYVNSTPALARLAGNTTTTRNFLRQTGNGTISAAPVWDTLVAGDIPNIAESQVTNLVSDLAGKVATTVTVNGHALSANVTISASDITTGTLPHAQLPTLVSGDIPNNAANTSGTAANLTAAALLPTGTTAATPSGGDNTQKIATTAFVAAYRAVNPMTTLGDTDYGGASGVETRLAGNTTTTKKFMTQTGDGTNSAAPSWGVIVAGDLPNHSTALLTSGTVALARGGTNADLSGTGGTSQVLKQTSVGGNITVAQLAASDLSNGTTGSGGGVVLATSPTIATPTITGTATMASATFSSTITNYNNVATQGVGIGSIIGADDLTGQTANVTIKDLVPAATITSNMLIRVMITWNETTIAAGGTPSSTLPSVVVTWTDADSGSAQSQTVAPSNSLCAGTAVTATANSLTTTRSQCVIICNCKSGVALRYNTTSYASTVTPTAMAYAIHARAERI